MHGRFWRGSLAKRAFLGVLSAILLFGTAGPSSAYRRPAHSERITTPLVDTPDKEGASGESSISGNGRYVAFESKNVALIVPDANLLTDIFVFDRATDEIELASVSSAGIQGVGESGQPRISRNGRYIAFYSEAVNLVEGDTNLLGDVFFHDQKTGETELVSVGPDGKPAESGAGQPSISDNGRFVAFRSNSANLVKGDTNGQSDIFLYDRKTRVTERISLTPEGTENSLASVCPSVSSSGRYVVFSTQIDGAISADDVRGVFVNDRKEKTIERVSIAIDGRPGSAVICDTDGHAISADGRIVAFTGGTNVDQRYGPFVPQDSGIFPDVYTYDRDTGRTERLSVTSEGMEGSIDGGSTLESLSRDGRFVTFYSSQSGFFCCDTTTPPGLGSDFDVFIHDRLIGTTEMVSVGYEGGEAADCGPGFYTSSYSHRSSVSDDGRFVSYRSCATNIVPEPRQYTGLSDFDIYVYDRGNSSGAETSSHGSGSSDSTKASEICLSSFTCVPPQGAVVTNDSTSDVNDVLTAQGANLYGASLAYRPKLGDLFARIELEQMPSLGVGTMGAGSGPSLLYRLSFEVEQKSYEVRATALAGGTFELFDCTFEPVCKKVADLKGGYGTTGERVVFSLPLNKIDLQQGGGPSKVTVSTAFGSALSGPVKILDSLELD